MSDFDLPVMPPHQVRVLDEKNQLDERLTALKSFIKNSLIYTGLDDGEKLRLVKQERVMQSYSDILAERIENFQNER